jgi:type IV pilus assembly protein PilA
MKVFCTRCGTPFEVEPAALQAVVTCPSCGNQFSPQLVPKKGGSGAGLSSAVLVIVILGALAVPCVGILAAIAIPNFIRFQGRSKQGECKLNLRSLSTAERAYFAEHQRFSTHPDEVGFSPERGNRYAYFLALEPKKMSSRADRAAAVDPEDVAVGVDSHRFVGQRAARQRRHVGEGSGARPGVTGQCPDCTFVAACVGNVDNDDTLDVWSISTADRTGPGGEPIAAGVPWNDVSDLTQ